MPALCPSSVPVTLGTGYLDKLAVNAILGIPKEMSIEEIDEAVEMFKNGARVAMTAGFKGVQIHGAHGFLVSEFLSPWTNRRTDDYGGTPEKRLRFLQRLVDEIYELVQSEFNPEEKKDKRTGFCLSVKLNSGDYMKSGGLTQSEALSQVRYLLTCCKIDLIEISGGNAEQSNSGPHKSFGAKSHEKALPMKESTRIREAYFTDFAEQVRELIKELFPDSAPRPAIQLSGGFRTRTGMTASILNELTDIIGSGRAAVLEPDLPKRILLDEKVEDERAMAKPHIVRGQWFLNTIPAKVVGSGLAIQFFYYNMRRLGKGMESAPEVSIPGMVVREPLEGLVRSMQGWLGWTRGDIMGESTNL